MLACLLSAQACGVGFSSETEPAEADAGSAIGVTTTTSGGAGGAGAMGGTGGAGAGTAGGSNESYAFRRNITVPTDAAMPAGFSVFVSLDHATLVSEGKSLPSGDDVRVFFDDGSAMVELHRMVDPGSEWGRADSMVWFKTVEDITADDTRYWLYYGNTSADAPPADGNEVFAFFDPFDDGVLDPSFTVSELGTVSGTNVQEANGVLTITAATSYLWGDVESAVFIHHPFSGDFAVDLKIVDARGQYGAWARLGAVMARPDLSPNPRFHLGCVFEQNATWGTQYRTTVGEDVAGTHLGASGTYPSYAGLLRVGDTTQAFGASNGIDWSPVGGSMTTALPESLLLGIAFANELEGDAGSIDVDWYRVRKATVPDNPVADLGAEESTL